MANQSFHAAAAHAGVLVVTGASRGIGAACARLGAQAGYRVVVNSSAAARLGGIAGMVAYAASKGAVDSFTTGLAREVGAEGIRVVGLRPGMIATDILTPMGGDALMRQTAPTIPLGRVGQPDEIAQAVVWLLSPAASYVHGTTIDVSGGR